MCTQKMIKSNNSALRKPWIPPPGKASKRIFVTKRLASGSKNIPMEGSNMRCEKMCNYRGANSAILNFFTKLQELQNDLKMMRVHHRSLKTCSELLHRPMKVSPMDERAIKNMILQADQNINAFLSSLQEFEADVNALENGLKNGSKETENYFNICQYNKDVTVVKLLKAYDVLTSSMKFLFEVQLQGELSLFEKDHSILNNKIDSLKEHLALRDVQVQGLEKKLSELAEQASNALREKQVLEERISQLTRELSQSTVMLERMQVQAKSREHLMKNPSENERLLQVIDDLHEKHKAEKEALKKALKMQKYHSEQCESHVSDLKVQLSEKHNLSCDLATERDRWKMQLTSASNNLLDLQNHSEELEKMNYSLKDHIKELEGKWDKQAQQKKDEVKKMETLLHESQRERDLLKESVAILEKQLSLASKEKLKNQQKEEQIHAKNHRLAEAAYQNLEVESKTLIALLQEVKDQFSKKSNEHSKDDGTKQINHLSVIQEKLAKEREERLRLEKRCEDLEKSVQNTRNNSSVVAAADVPEFQPLSYPHTYMTEYNRILSEENVRQANTRDSLLSVNRSEMQGLEKRLKALEDELEQKKDKILTLETGKIELDKTKSEKIRDLQGKLERSMLTCDSLRKYIEMLKSSYVNVFGET